MARPVTQGGIDYPDGGFPSGQDVYPLTGDLAELAARLGSPVNFDRRGNVIFLEDFRYGFAKVETLGALTGGTVTLNTDAARSAPYSAKCVITAFADSSGGVVAHFPSYTGGNIGVEASFVKHDNMGYFVIYLHEYDGTNYYAYGLRWNNSNDTVEYYDEDGSWQSAGITAALRAESRLFHTMKMVVDTDDNVYVRALLNRHKESLADISPHQVASSLYYHYRFYAEYFGSTDGTTTGYLDDLILTQNEPD